MTCKDCIHHNLCFDNGTLFLNHAKGIDRENAETKCPFKSFKNKADFVEVVRCKDCTHANDDGTICHYSVGGRAVEPEHFCSYGERRDT